MKMQNSPAVRKLFLALLSTSLVARCTVTSHRGFFLIAHAEQITKKLRSVNELLVKSRLTTSRATSASFSNCCIRAIRRYLRIVVIMSCGQTVWTHNYFVRVNISHDTCLVARRRCVGYHARTVRDHAQHCIINFNY